MKFKCLKSAIKEYDFQSENFVEVHLGVNVKTLRIFADVPSDIAASEDCINLTEWAINKCGKKPGEEFTEEDVISWAENALAEYQRINGYKTSFVLTAPLRNKIEDCVRKCGTVAFIVENYKFAVVDDNADCTVYSEHHLVKNGYILMRWDTNHNELDRMLHMLRGRKKLQIKVQFFYRNNYDRPDATEVI